MGEMSARLLLCLAFLPVVAAGSGCGGGTSRAPTVTFRRDALGVPYVDTKDPAKAFCALGFAAAQHRLWQSSRCGRPWGHVTALWLRGWWHGAEGRSRRGTWRKFKRVVLASGAKLRDRNRPASTASL